MNYIVRPAAGHNPWLVREYPGRRDVIAGVTIHATRSGAAEADYDDGPGTERWGMNPNNGSTAKGWGTYWDRLVWRDGTLLICTETDHQYAAWTAGYGDAGTWALGIHYIQIEVAQSRPDQPFSGAEIDSLAQEVADLSRHYDFPLVRIPYVAQTEDPKPRGITTHEGSANGRKLGKTDPGALFPWERFLSLARRYREEEDNMTAEQIATLEEHSRQLELLNRRLDTLTDLIRSTRTEAAETIGMATKALDVAEGVNAAMVQRLDLLEVGVGPIKGVRAATKLLDKNGLLPEKGDQE